MKRMSLQLPDQQREAYAFVASVMYPDYTLTIACDDVSFDSERGCFIASVRETVTDEEGDETETVLTAALWPESIPFAVVAQSLYDRVTDEELMDEAIEHEVSMRRYKQIAERQIGRVEGVDLEELGLE